ncbi:hypothetical protein BD413DRAFT_94004 [Trametes elegans]|nr:hypothetical protein BD413DRAFT_94004 [Trametes elegans]
MDSVTLVPSHRKRMSSALGLDILACLASMPTHEPDVRDTEHRGVEEFRSTVNTDSALPYNKRQRDDTDLGKGNESMAVAQAAAAAAAVEDEDGDDPEVRNVVSDDVDGTVTDWDEDYTCSGDERFRKFMAQADAADEDYNTADCDSDDSAESLELGRKKRRKRKAIAPEQDRRIRRPRTTEMDDSDPWVEFLFEQPGRYATPSCMPIRRSQRLQEQRQKQR